MGVCKLQLGAIPMPHTLSGSMTSCEDQGSAASGLILFGAEHGKFYAQGVKKKKTTKVILANSQGRTTLQVS